MLVDLALSSPAAGIICSFAKGTSVCPSKMGMGAATAVEEVLQLASDIKIWEYLEVVGKKQ